jgi:hypothetical protein
VGCLDDEAPCDPDRNWAVSFEEETVVLNVTVRCGFGGVALFALLPPDMDDINGVVSELDAIVVRGWRLQWCRDNWTV